MTDDFSTEKAFPSTLYEYSVKEISGEEYTLDKYRGKILLIVNTASKCGFTPQYDNLEKLYQRYKEKGLIVLAFPSDSFKQELETDTEIKQFCSTNYKITFPLFGKVSVKGLNKHPLFDWLTDRTANPDWGGKIGWNFAKFLISRDGVVLDRFPSNENPLNDTILEAIEEALET